MDDAEQVVRVAAEWLAQGRKVCVATIVAREGSAPREVGAKMAVSDRGETVGSIGGGGLEQEVVKRAERALEDGRPAVIEFDLGAERSEVDAFCGGTVSVLLEPLGDSCRLFVIGAGHVGAALARAARVVGFAVTVVDDRKEFLSAEVLGPGVDGVVASAAEAGDLGIDSKASVVICTRGHSLDKEWLRAVARLGPRYVGMLGSREKATKISGELGGEGVPADFLGRVRTPVGLPIDAVTPEEIAISIVAELVMERRAGTR